MEEGSSSDRITRRLALDCEFVGCGLDGEDNQLARVSIVNENCECVYDKFVKPRERIIDYRTKYSGIRPEMLRNGADFRTVQQEVHDLLKDRVLVGHAIKNDLRVLFLDHPRSMIRDTSRYKPLRELAAHRGGTPSLRMLTERLLKKRIQEGEHDSVEDARATMQLYLLVKKRWEADVRAKFGLRTTARSLKQKMKKKAKAKKNAVAAQNEQQGNRVGASRNERNNEVFMQKKMQKGGGQKQRPFILFHVDQLTDKSKRSNPF